MKWIDLLSNYDLVIDNYEVRMKNGLVKTISFCVDNQPVITDVIINGKNITGNKAIDLLEEIAAENIGSIQVVSKHELSRRKRHDRRREWDYCPALRRIQLLIDGEEEEEETRYDNKINSELLPNYTLNLWDVLEGSYSKIA